MNNTKKKSLMGDILLKARKDKGLTQSQLAAMVGVAVATISRWETGEIGSMRIDRIEKVASVLGITPATILGIKEKQLSCDTIPLVSRLDFDQPYIYPEETTREVGRPFDFVADFAFLEKKNDNQDRIVFIKRNPKPSESGLVAVLGKDGIPKTRTLLVLKEKYIVNDADHGWTVLDKKSSSHIHLLGKVVASCELYGN
jgi:transcriptional regulator with XRE-family HTH domain